MTRGSGTAKYLLKIGCSLLLVHFVAMTHDDSLLRLARWCVLSGKLQSAPQTLVLKKREREGEHWRCSAAKQVPAQAFFARPWTTCTV